jgi:hypothetical protein
MLFVEATAPLAGDPHDCAETATSACLGVWVAAERKTGKLDFDVGRPDALEIRIEVSGCPFLDIERL